MTTRVPHLPSPRNLRRLALLALILLACRVAFALSLHLVPLPAALRSPPPASLELTDRHGRTLREIPHDDRRFTHPTRLEQIPEPLIHATLAAEDKRFFQHSGVDSLATLRAAWSLVRHRRIFTGGSTITQQLIKIAEPRPRTFATKIREAAQALRLEQLWTKDRILTEYLNRLDYGDLCFGVAAAAEHFFAKPLADLSPAEAALLAGLPQAPSRLNPHRHRDRALRRQHWILGRMHDLGHLDPARFQAALKEAPRLAPAHRPFQAPHFVELLRQRHRELFTRPAGASIRTSLDLELQRVAETSVRTHLTQLREKSVRNAAAVILDNRTGEVLALVGSEDFFSPVAGQINGAWAPRSAGSTFKPFTYLLALEHGANPATIIADIPTDFATPTGIFSPANYSQHCLGPVRLRHALANSLNLPAVKTLATLGGPAPLQQLLQSCGLTTLTQPPAHYGLGLTLGNAEARLLELANAYATLARLGAYQPFRLLPPERGWPARTSLKLADSPSQFSPPNENYDDALPHPAPLPLGEGATLTAPPTTQPPLANDRGQTFSLSQRERAGVRENAAAKSEPQDSLRNRPFAPQKTKTHLHAASVGNFTTPAPAEPLRAGRPRSTAAYLIADILSDNAARTPSFGVNSPLRFPFPVACKTGTSSDFRDNWAFSYTPEFTVGVWAGNFDGSPMQGVSGVSGAAPILHDLFVHLHQRHGTTWFAPPPTLIENWIHPLTGKSVPPAHPDAIREKFLPPSLPDPATATDYDPAGRVLLAPEYAPWFASGDNHLAARAALAPPAATAPLRLVAPLPGTTFYLDPDLPDTSRHVRLRADGPPGIRWHSDSLKTHADDHGQPTVLLTPGHHRLTAIHPNTGAQTETWIVVKRM